MICTLIATSGMQVSARLVCAEVWYEHEANHSVVENRPNTSQVANAVNEGHGLP